MHSVLPLWFFIMLVNDAHTGFYPDSQFVPVYVFISAEETYY